MVQTKDSKADSRLHVAIIGGGAAGMACALEAVERGGRVTLIEHRGLDATSPSAVSICTKVLHRAAQMIHLRSSSPFDAAISPTTPSIQSDALLELQRQQVEAICERRLTALQNSQHIKLMEGEARFLDKDKLIVRLNDDSRKLSFRKVPFDRCLIASGSIPEIPQIPGLGDTPYWTATEALASPGIPPRLIVMGCSDIAMELGQIFARLGSRVAMLPGESVFFAEEPLVDAAITDTLKAEGIAIFRDTEANEVSFEGGEFVLATNRGEMRAERMLVATGRVPNTHSLCLDLIGVDLGVEGHVQVDDHMRSSVPDIYAAGDCADMPPFANIAAEAGRCAAGNIMTGDDASLDLNTAPRAAFTDPQVATVGLFESEAPSRGIETVSRILPLERLPSALVDSDIRGFIKVVAEAGSLRLLGVQAVMPQAGEFIQTAAVALGAHMSVRDVADQPFSDLTMAEGLRLCARLFGNDAQ